ncbi:MAG: DUF1573 domain-containing protein [Sedimentisphaerales bacterium]|nr:DUF1573 domain-containing protein [Sedimentisphaerales bacterium]
MRNWKHLLIILILNVVSLTIPNSVLFAGTNTIIIDQNSLLPGGNVTCGSQCLYLFCKLKGISINIDDLLKTVPHHQDGASMLNLKKAAESLGLTSNGYKVDFDGLKKLPLPAIIHLNESHYLLLLEVGKNKVKLADTSTRSVFETGRKEFINEWSGYVLTLEIPDNSDIIKLSEKGETIYIQKPIWDLGKSPSGKTYNHSFTLINAGKEPLEILDVKTSCGCTVPEYTKSPIPPGSKSELNVTMYSEGRSGPYSGQIIVKTNSKDYPLLTMDIKAEFKLYQGNISVFPQNIVWEEILKGKEVSQKVKVLRHGEDPLNFIRATCDIPNIKVNIIENAKRANLESNKYVELDLVVSNKMPIGEFHGFLEIETKHSKYPTIKISIEGNVGTGIHAEPRVIFLSLKNNTNKRSITLKSEIDEPFKIINTSLNPTDFPGKVTYSKINDSQWEINFEVNGPLSKGIMNGSIVINTDIDDTPQITIPVTITQ